MANNQPDVRIRLSAEGVQEVVNALRNVQQQAQQTSQAAADTGNGFQRAISGVVNLKNAVQALAATAAVAMTAQFARSMIDAATAVGKLSEKTGLAVEEVSRLQYAFQQFGIDAEGFADTMNEFSIRISEADAGTGEAVNAFKAMGVSLRDNKGNLRNQSDLLNEVADKFASYKDGANKAALADKLFGDAGAALIPVMNRGAAGLAKLKEESDKVGNTLSETGVRSASEFSKNINRLTAEASALARVIAGPLVKSLADAAVRFMNAINAKQGFLNGVKAVMDGTGQRTNVADAEADVKRTQAAYTDYINKMKKGDFVPASKLNELAGAYQRATSNLKALKAEEAKLPSGNNGKGGKNDPRQDAPNPEAAGAAAGAADKAAAAAAALAKARSEATVAAAERELRALRARNKSAGEEDKAALEQGLLDLESYHDKRLAELEADATAELQVLQRKLDAASAAPAKTDAEKVARARAVDDAQAAIDERKAQREIDLAAAQRARLDAILARNEALADITAKVAAADMSKRDVAVAALNDEIRKMDELLRKQGIALDERNKLTDAYRASRMPAIDMEQKRSEADRANAGFDARRGNVELERKTGKIWNFEADAQLAKIEEERAARMSQIADEMERIAKLQPKNEELQQQAAAYRSMANELKASTDSYGQAIARIRDTLESSAASGLNTLFDNIISGSMNAKDAVRSFAADVIDSVRKIAQELLVQQAIKSFFGAFGGGGGLGGMLGFSTGGAVKAATGGYIAGPGTGTSDSIPAWLSNGEYVVKAASVQAVGLQALESINKYGRLPVNFARHSAGNVARFADGGLVGSVADAAGGTTSLQIGLADGLVLEQLQSKAGQKVIVETIGRNRRAVNQRIG